MMDCDRDCCRCTYAACMSSDDHEDQRKSFDIQNRRPKSKSTKVEAKDYLDYYIEEYTLQSSSKNYDF